MDTSFEIFLATVPGLEPVLCDEARALGFADSVEVPGGVTVRGGWPEVWRANLCLRGASRVLARVAVFRALHLAQLDKRAHRVPWAEVLRPDVAVRVQASCRASRIYHAGAAAERVGRAIADTVGAPTVLAPAKPDGDGLAVAVQVRIEDDLCTLSVDTSGELLHRRGHKEEVNKAPLRESLAALFLRRCGFDGREAVMDPMCGSGTFVLEAADWAAGLAPGRSRTFAFQHLAGFDPDAWGALRDGLPPPAPPPDSPRFLGSDRDAGAIRMSLANAERAGVTAWTAFAQRTIGEVKPPDNAPPGLVMVNPPYGTRLGERTELAPLYRALGRMLAERFSGWRVGLLSTDTALARATGLPFVPPDAPVPHGGLRVTLWRTGPLP